MAVRGFPSLKTVRLVSCPSLDYWFRIGSNLGCKQSEARESAWCVVLMWSLFSRKKYQSRLPVIVENKNRIRRLVQCHKQIPDVHLSVPHVAQGYVKFCRL